MEREGEEWSSLEEGEKATSSLLEESSLNIRPQSLEKERGRKRKIDGERERERKIDGEREREIERENIISAYTCMII